jgi:tetratricopeptide (TPR) repeat protein
MPASLLSARLFSIPQSSGFLVQLFADAPSVEQYGYGFVKLTTNGFTYSSNVTRTGLKQIVASNYLRGLIERFSAEGEHVAPTIRPANPSRDTFKMLIELYRGRIELRWNSLVTATQGALVAKTLQANTCPAEETLTAILCRSPALRDKDRAAIAEYGLLAAKLSPSQLQTLRMEQNAWQKKVQSCQDEANISGCLDRAYETRLAELRGQSLVDRTATAKPLSESLIEYCNDNDVDRGLAGCTALIEAKTLDVANTALAYSRRSDIYIQKRDLDRAIADRSRSVQLQPNDPQYKMRLSGAYQIRAALRQKLDKVAALADLAESIKIDPSNYEARIQRAEYLADKDLDQAIKEIEEAIKSGFQNVSNVNWLSALYVKRALQRSLVSDLQGAVSDYGSAIELDATDPVLFYNHGSTYLMKGIKN